ncbi:hypothetical protein ABIE53_001825 [Burkholderia sp. OAS925]
MTERHITQKHPVRKANRRQAPENMPGALVHMRECGCIREGARRTRGPSRLSPHQLQRGMPREKALQALDARIQPRDVARVAPAQEALALGTERAAGRDSQADFAHQRLA